MNRPRWGKAHDRVGDREENGRMKYLMLAAWFVGSNPPVPFQAELSSKEACMTAYAAMHRGLIEAELKARVFAVCVEK